MRMWDVAAWLCNQKRHGNTWNMEDAFYFRSFLMKEAAGRPPMGVMAVPVGMRPMGQRGQWGFTLSFADRWLVSGLVGMRRMVAGRRRTWCPKAFVTLMSTQLMIYFGCLLAASFVEPLWSSLLDETIFISLQGSRSIVSPHVRTQSGHEVKVKAALF